MYSVYHTRLDPLSMRFDYTQTYQADVETDVDVVLVYGFIKYQW